MAERSIRGLPVSLVAKLKLLPLNNCVKKTTLTGIRLPNGDIVVSPEITNHPTLKIFAETVGGDIVYVTGEWHFKPLSNDDDEEETKDE